jgi:ABC-type transporter Mla maintaining outer membrane lipid asymmetry ATPase subunit MlaF
VTIESQPPGEAHATEFIMLRESGIGFEGSAGELRESADPYLRSFLS